MNDFKLKANTGTKRNVPCSISFILASTVTKNRSLDSVFVMFTWFDLPYGTKINIIMTTLFDRHSLFPQLAQTFNNVYLRTCLRAGIN